MGPGQQLGCRLRRGLLSGHRTPATGRDVGRARGSGGVAGCAGAENIFGIPGGAILPAYDPLFDSVKLRHILVRHEQGAGHAAQGYAAAT
ncbi:MAG: thiamine pyrophosphate-binding protein, partial [Actinomycetota bacterium]